MTRRARSLAAALALAVVAAVPMATPAGARARAYLAGAATVSISPPQTGVRVGGDLCPPKVWKGPSTWDQDEPYRDLNGNGEWDIGNDSTFPEPFCDANLNGRYDGIFVSGGVAHHALRLNDEIWVRTFVVSDGTTAVAVASVDSLGMFAPDVEAARALVTAQHPGTTLFVTSDHNESSPDPIGLYGPSQDSDDIPVGTTSGVNDYYMTFLEGQIAHSVEVAMAALRPATLSIAVTTDPLIVPSFKQWPTSNRHDPATATPNPFAAGRIDAWNPKIHVLQARDVATGATIFTAGGYAAHIQNLGHSGETGPAGIPWERQITADWVRYFNDGVQAAQGGVAIYLQGTNGDIETPEVPSRGVHPEGSLARSIDIGTELAAAVNRAVPTVVPVPFGPVRASRDVFTAPLENNLFVAAFAAKVFPHRSLLPPAPGGTRPQLQTEVGLIRFGTVELFANPGEAFPLLLKGGHWGIDEVCATRANPPAPSWYSTARYRWDLGLANDMIGYELPAWGWDESPAIYAEPTDPCSLNATKDGGGSSVGEGGHQHALEDESLGPTGANLVAQHLTDLVQIFDGVGANRIVGGRYLFADGSLSRRPYRAPFAGSGVVAVSERAIGMVFPSVKGLTVVMIAGRTQAGAYRANASGTFVDFDGAAQPAGADQHTRGMLVGSQARPTYLDVFPAFTP